MADTEEYFPRGGKKPSALFKKSSNFLGAPEKSVKKKKIPKKKSEGDDGYLSDDETREIDTSSKNCAIGLSKKTIKQGVLVLGRVKQVQETKLIVMLPGRLMGYVMACHISEAYNKLLEAYVNDQVEKVIELAQMFKPGQYIALKVLEIQGHNIMLSMMPQHVNGGKQAADLVKGALFQAAVSSVEDHGFVMDVGVPNTRTFLPKNEVNPDIALDVGMVTWCAVKSVTSTAGDSVVTLSATPNYVENGVLRRKPKTPLLPGTTVEFVVDTPLDNGIEGQIFGDTTCYIQRQHVDLFKGKKPALGQKIKACVLYVMPTRNTPFLTMKNIFAPVDLTQEQQYQDGDIIEDAQVLKILGRSVHFKLNKDAFGILSLRRIQTDEELTDEDIVAKSYPVGSTHKVRILGYQLSDYVYAVSDQPEVVNEPYFRLSQLNVGDLVPATITSVGEKDGLDVTVGRIKGYVPHLHITEAGLVVDPKKARTSKLPQKKFKVGQTVTARVLVVDPNKPMLLVTLKPTLLQPEYEVLKSYDEVQVGKAYTGVVRFIRDYLLVSFFNKVTAFIPRWFVSSEKDSDVMGAFHLGQLLTCTIVSVDPARGKMTGSLITQPFTHDENRKTKKRKQKSEESEETPHKKHKSDDDDDDAEFTKKKKKSKSDSENIEDEVEVKAKKEKRSKSGSESIVDEEVEVETKKEKKKKRNNSDISEDDSREPVRGKKAKIKQETECKDALESEVGSKTKKKNKKKRNDDSDVTEETHAFENYKNDVKLEGKVSEESDAIETDFQDEEILTPHDQGLLDMSDCNTIEEYKKRARKLRKSIEARERRIERIDRKIKSIEEFGLTARNKKFHTAMHSERLVVIERSKKLLEGWELVQKKLREMGVTKNEDYKIEQRRRKKEKLELLEQKKKMKKNKGEEKSQEDDKMDSVVDIKVVESLEPAVEVPSAKDFWSANADNLTKAAKEEESSSSEDETQDQPKKKRKKLTVAEKLSKLREEEERVRALEAAAAEGAAAPRSVDQFERAVLAQPACSQLWIAYMAFHLQATELDKARGVARKALSTIPFREEEEKLNVWLALINLEQRFGTKESQQKTLEDALQTNEPYKVHSKLLDIYVETGKQQELTSLVDLMMRKYKRDVEAYIAAGSACFKLGLVDKARHVMQKGISVLEKKDHVYLLVQFALLERSHGGRERAEALFEQVLAVYPQRVDVCAVYVDMLLKGGDVDQVRQVMERMTSQKLPARKMKILYKKWIEVEEKHGDASQVENIRQRAMEFIEKAKF